MLLEKIREFQKFLYQSGMARRTISLPAPSILAIANPTSLDMELDIIFDRFVDESEIVEVSRDLFDSGHCNIAVQEAFKAVDNFIQLKVSEHNMSGTFLMDCVFSPNSPKLVWNDRKTRPCGRI